MILANIFPGTDKRVMPRQLLQTVLVHFLGIFTIMPFFQSAGTFLCLQIDSKSLNSVLSEYLGSELKISGQSTSDPGAFPFFRVLLASSVSPRLGVSSHMLTCRPLHSTLAASAGSG